MTTGKLISVGTHTMCADDNTATFIAIDSAVVEMDGDNLREVSKYLYTKVRIVFANAFDLAAHLTRQNVWAQATFGPGPRTAALSDHIRRELLEIAADPSDTREWLDVVILAFEGALRTGATPEYIAEAITSMQARNEARTWPDWRTAPQDAAIEHVRTTNECNHTNTNRGPDIPLPHGSYRSEVCECGMWRMTGHSPPLPISPWRTDSLEAVANLPAGD